MHLLDEREIKSDKTMVYLTADSPNVLQTMDSDHCYIIGGIVDRNRQKGLCLKRAQEMGINHARLPIKDHVSLNSRHILTVNQVVDILVGFMETLDWKEALLKVIPVRKLEQEAKSLAESHKVVCEVSCASVDTVADCVATSNANNDENEDL